jgi:hypothetical protein
MSDTVRFTGVILQSFTRKPASGGTATFRSNYPTEATCKAMGWGGMASGQTSAKLEGRLAATHAHLQPKDGELGKWEVEFDATAVDGFEGVRFEIEGKRGKGHRLELNFKVHFADKTACAALESYMVTMGEGKGTLTVSYVQQTAMDLEGEDDKQERLISKAQAKDTASDD